MKDPRAPRSPDRWTFTAVDFLLAPVGLVLAGVRELDLRYRNLRERLTAWWHRG